MLSALNGARSDKTKKRCRRDRTLVVAIAVVVLAAAARAWGRASPLSRSCIAAANGVRS